MSSKVLADSGLFVALFNPKDKHYASCHAFMQQYRGVLITCWAAFTEATSMMSHMHVGQLFKWAQKLIAAKKLIIEHPPAEAVMPLWDLLNKYEDLPMDFCDASLVYLATTHKIDHIATIDKRDFSVYRLPNNKPFVHVLEPYQ
jgi:uncharacterized protein